ncbi:hypothetical protein N665_1722s0003 [Sinapis alba]|nr:hypothetical protein N665_1722s0003 [Sinapis alba]
MDFKMDLLAFQEAYYKDKWPRNHGVMIQFSKPAKPVLHMSQLEVNRFNQLQTKHWRPGEFLNNPKHSEDQSNRPEEPPLIFPYTSNHRIKRIFIYLNLPYQDTISFHGNEDQRLYFHYQSLLNILLKNLDLPRLHHFLPKLSRFKEPSNPPHLAFTLLNAPTVSFLYV